MKYCVCQKYTPKYNNRKMKTNNILIKLKRKWKTNNKLSCICLKNALHNGV